MTAPRLVFALASLFAFTVPAYAQSDGPIEPNAGNWKPWVISSVRIIACLRRLARLKPVTN